MITKILKKTALTTLIGVPLIFGIPLTNAKADDQQYIDRIRGMSYEQVIKYIKTPEQAKKYLTTFLSYKDDQENFGIKDYMASFKRIHENESDDCDGGTLAAAALLSDDGYPPLQLMMYHSQLITKGNFNKAHAIFIYKQNGKWGTLGIDKEDYQKAKYSSIEEIVKDHKFLTFVVTNIEEKYPEYIDNNINMIEKLFPQRFDGPRKF